ncbi:MAG: signal peptidase I [Gammaproteobacteria bacterium]|nr:signal peptidase I [Gammaproteobacteria bacterium]
MKNLWKEWRVFIFIILAMGVFRSAIANWYLVPTGSMKPTILEGDYVLTDKTAYQLHIPFTDHVVASWAQPQRGDIVVFSSPRDGIRLVKRVVGLPGDSIEMRDNRLLINGKVLDYQLGDQGLAVSAWADSPLPLVVDEDLGDVQHPIAVHDSRNPYYQNFPVQKIPGGHYFMLGDNRDNSGDSRVFGMVAEHLIDGRARYIILSLDWDGSYLPRSGRALSRLN